MDVFDAITSRRSVREFSAEEVGGKLIEKILDAGRWAPSGLNNQPWWFKLVKDVELKIRTFPPLCDWWSKSAVRKFGGIRIFYAQVSREGLPWVSRTESSVLYMPPVFDRWFLTQKNKRLLSI